MKSTGLIQLVGKLHQACKIHNLHQVCGVFNYVPVNKTSSFLCLDYCSFEEQYPTLCGYTRSSGSFRWLLGSGSTLSTNTGPPNDHTLGDSRGRSRKISQLAGSLPTICQEVMFALLVPRLLISMQQAVTNL